MLEKEASLDLVKKGPHPEEIEAARAELKRLQAQLASNEERPIRTTMHTIIPERITNLEIENLEGSYLEAGDLFAELIEDRALKAYTLNPTGLEPEKTPRSEDPKTICPGPSAMQPSRWERARPSPGIRSYPFH